MFPKLDLHSSKLSLQISPYMIVSSNRFSYKWLDALDGPNGEARMRRSKHTERVKTQVTRYKDLVM